MHPITPSPCTTVILSKCKPNIESRDTSTPAASARKVCHRTRYSVSLHPVALQAIDSSESLRRYMFCVGQNPIERKRKASIIHERMQKEAPRRNSSSDSVCCRSASTNGERNCACAWVPCAKVVHSNHPRRRLAIVNSALSEMTTTPRRSVLDAMLVLPRLCDVANPLDGLVVALLEDFQETHVQARCRKHGHLQLRTRESASARQKCRGGVGGGEE